MAENGFYSITFGGSGGSGVGVVVLQNGVITGADGGGNIYDGRYEPDAQSGALRFHVDVTIPAHMPMVLGEAPHPEPWTFSMNGTLPANFANGLPITIQTQFAPLSVSFKLIRKL